MQTQEQNEAAQAEGQILDDEQVIDDLVRIADNLRSMHHSKQEVYEDLLEKQPKGFDDRRWRHLVKSAMEYV